MRGVALICLLPLAGCAGAHRDPAPTPSTTAPAASKTSVAATMQSVMDPKTDPCTDFYRYACGAWLDRTPIPADQPRWGRGFSEIRERNQNALRQILEEARTAKSGDSQKIGAYYAACMDTKGIEAAGTAPLQPWMAEIDAAAGAPTLAPTMALAAKLQSAGAGALFGWQSAGDFKNPEVGILHLQQGGLGLPDRDYYLKEDAAGKQVLEAYRGHVGRMLVLAGEPQAAADADAARVLDFETRLARASKPRAELRDPDKNYHKLDRAGLATLTPDLPWDAYFGGLGRPDLDGINVGQPEFFQALDRELKDAEPATRAAYLRWHLVHGLQDLLPEAFAQEDFALYGKTLQGQKELEPRWKRCVAQVDEGLGEILGKAFVDRNFPGDSKQISLEMIQRVEAAFASRLPDLTWMDDATRARALEKLHAVRNQIGYPDKWRSYAGLEVTPDAWLKDGLAARAFETKRRITKVGKPVDRDEWLATPPTVNAYYNPLFNQMVFLAGILQPPFFDRSFPAPMNFGAIGMVMGHELTHGFDDQGRKFDKQGKLVEWWEPAVSERFEERAQCVDDLYSSYEVQPGVHLNGKLTMGENIADLGGIKQAYIAYQGWKKEHGTPKVDVPGITDDQLVFLGYAQAWCTVTTPEFDKLRAATDPHSNPRSRVNGPLSQLPAFSAAFACKAGAPMNPEKKCEVW